MLKLTKPFQDKFSFVLYVYILNPLLNFLTRTLGQSEGFALLEGRHLVEGLVLLGVLEAAEVDTLAVQNQVGELLGQMNFGFGGF